jgi:hypothetical protein
MLHQRDTFTIANSFPVIIHDPNHTVDQYSTDNGQLARMSISSSPGAAAGTTTTTAPTAAPSTAAPTAAAESSS